MTRRLNLPAFESSDSDPNPTLNVVIAYEDFETGKHAKQTYDFLTENLGHECRFANQMWKFEVLCIPKLREMAARDAAQADIVLISCRGHELPPEVKAWIELWVNEPNHPLALVALFPPDQIGNGAQEIRSYLSDVARRGQMEFFAQPDQRPGKGVEDFVDLERQTTLGARFLNGVAQRGDMSIPHWGINE